MAQTFSLGPVTFTGFEVPENLKLPRKTAMTTHQIPQTDDSAAEKIGQTFGTFPETIEVEGTYLGTNADDMIRQLEAIQDAQQVIPFTMGPRVFDVLIAEFEAEYVSIGEVNFTATLEPLLERRAGSASPTQDAGTQIEASLDQVTSLTPQVQPLSIDPSVYSNLQIVQSQRSSIGTISLADVATQISFGQTIYNAIQSLQNELNTLRQTSGVSNEIQTLESLSGYLSSAYQTLQTYTGQSSISPTVQEANTTAYAVAAKYTGDWRNYKAIMTANNLTDPMIVGSMYLTIPRI